MADAKISEMLDGGLPTAGDKLPLARDENMHIDGGTIANSASLDDINTRLNSVTAKVDSTTAQTASLTNLSNRLDSAYARANAAYALAQTAQSVIPNANASLALAQAAYDRSSVALNQASTATTHVAQAWNTANAALLATNTTDLTAFTQAAYNQANTGGARATQASTQGQTAYNQANGVAVVVTAALATSTSAVQATPPAYNQANAAYALAQDAYTRSAADSGFVANGLGGLASLSNYIINRTDFNEPCTAPTSGANYVLSPSGRFWCMGLRPSNTLQSWASTDLTGTTTNNSNVIANLAVGTALNACALSLSNTSSYGPQVGIVNYGGQAGRTSTKPPGSAENASGPPVAKLFQADSQHSIGAGVSILVSAPGLCGRVAFGYNSYSPGFSIKESGVWLEAFYTDTNWQLTYTPGYGDSNTNYNHTRVRFDTGVPISFSSGNVFTRLRIDWDGPGQVLTAYINEAIVAQLGPDQMPTDAYYAQGVVILDQKIVTGSDFNTNAPRYVGGSPDAVLGTIVLVDQMDFVGYYPNGRKGW